MNGNGTPKLTEVPTLDALTADPTLVQSLPVQVVQHMLIQITSLLPLLVAKSHRCSTEANGEDRLLTIEAAASVLGKSKDWMYRHAESLPFTVREGRLLRFSNNGIQKYIHIRLQQG